MADVSRRIAPLIEAGVVATTASLDAEALYSARGPAEYEQLWADRRSAYEYLPTDDEHWQTALGTQRALARLEQFARPAPQRIAPKSPTKTEFGLDAGF